MSDEKEDIKQKKETALLKVLENAYADYDRAMAAIVLIATAAKRKTSLDLIGAQAIMNEKEPEPVTGTGPEPMDDEEKKDAP